MGEATKTTFLLLNLEPEGIPDLPTSSVMLQGTLGFDTTTRTFSVPTLGPGRYRLRASLITNGPGGPHVIRIGPGAQVIDIGPGGASLPLTLPPAVWAGARSP
jgi:hypothetical protein